MEHILHAIGVSFAPIQALLLAVAITAAPSQGPDILCRVGLRAAVRQWWQTVVGQPGRECADWRLEPERRSLIQFRNCF
jgi:hypothetical protein